MNSVTTQEKQQLRKMEQEKQTVAPPVNICETADGYSLEAEMPGVNKEGLSITLEGNHLSIEGRRQHPEIQGETLYQESREADYRRVFELDPAVDTAKISARMDQGVLKLHLPKAERVKPRKIAIS
jgi:HSP20 family protein